MGADDEKVGTPAVAQLCAVREKLSSSTEELVQHGL